VSRKLTTYTEPSVAERLARAPSIDVLRLLRGSLAVGSIKGNVDPSEKTEKMWEHIFWRRVIELMLTPGGDCPTYIYNEALRWSKPPHVADAIEMALKTACAFRNPTPQ